MAISECGLRIVECCGTIILRVRWFWDTMGERILRIGRIRTDFFGQFQFDSRAKKKKSVRIRPIRPIRFPIVSHCIPKPSDAPYSNIPKSEIRIPKSKDSANFGQKKYLIRFFAKNKYIFFYLNRFVL
jgi:hypothetical protein